LRAAIGHYAIRGRDILLTAIAVIAGATACRVGPQRLRPAPQLALDGGGPNP